MRRAAQLDADRGARLRRRPDHHRRRSGGGERDPLRRRPAPGRLRRSPLPGRVGGRAAAQRGHHQGAPAPGLGRANPGRERTGTGRQRQRQGAGPPRSSPAGIRSGRVGPDESREAGTMTVGTSVQSLMRLWLKYSNANHFDDSTWEPAAAQRDKLLEICARNATTAYGREYGFDGIRSVADYQARVPPSTYDTLSPYIDRMRRGERGVLTQDQPVMFATTSGTT